MDREEAVEILRKRRICALYVSDADALDLAIEALRKVSVYEQVKWERDMALQTLEEHGIGLGQKSDWIPVSEGLPEGYDQYLCYCEDGCFYVYWLDNEPWAENTVEIDGIIAWRPLPKPYKDGDVK